ncbi:MAG: transcriptional regulator [Thaumarchaeota archaeon]|nr:transcriptional regulator [Nitrososphaerota archaeon]
MSKQQYRSELGIISDVLQVAIDGGRSGVIISTISRGANLSHYTAMEKCQKLVGFGLMETANKERNNSYSITEKGIQFFQEMRKFIEIVEQVKIRY